MPALCALDGCADCDRTSPLGSMGGCQRCCRKSSCLVDQSSSGLPQRIDFCDEYLPRLPASSPHSWFRTPRTWVELGMRWLGDWAAAWAELLVFHRASGGLLPEDRCSSSPCTSAPRKSSRCSSWSGSHATLARRRARCFPGLARSAESRSPTIARRRGACSGDAGCSTHDFETCCIGKSARGPDCAGSCDGVEALTLPGCSARGLRAPREWTLMADVASDECARMDIACAGANGAPPSLSLPCAAPSHWMVKCPPARMPWTLTSSRGLGTAQEPRPR